MRTKLLLSTFICLFLSNNIFANDADLCKRKFESQVYWEAIPYCEKACNLDNGMSCFYLGELYGSGVRQAYGKARIYCEKACDLDESMGCTCLGELYYNGRGVTRDYGKARIYYEKACDLNDGKGCVELGWLYQKGLGVRQDNRQAFTYYVKSCNLSNGYGCDRVGSFYWDAIGIKGNIVGIDDRNFEQSRLLRLRIAKEYFGKSCDLGHQTGCDTYRYFNENGW